MLPDPRVCIHSSDMLYMIVALVEDFLCILNLCLITTLVMIRSTKYIVLLCSVYNVYFILRRVVFYVDSVNFLTIFSLYIEICHEHDNLQLSSKLLQKEEAANVIH